MIKKGIPERQKQVRGFIAEYGIAAAIEGTGLPLCAVRSACHDPEPVYDHLVRVYQFYMGLAHEQSLYDIHYELI